MGFSTIVILMLINGYAFCEIVGAPQGGKAHLVGCVCRGSGRRKLATALGRPGQTLASDFDLEFWHDAPADCLFHLSDDDEQQEPF